MPIQKRHRAIRALAVAGVVLGAMAVPAAAVGPGPEGGPCLLPPTSKVFAAFADDNNYYLAGGGAFEYGADRLLGRGLDTERDHLAAWTGNLMASVVSGNEPFRLAGRADRSSMRLRAGGRVTSTPFCVSADQPHLRLVARSLGGGGELRVRVSTVGWTGAARATTTVLAPAAHRAWAPSRYIPLNTTGMPADERGLAYVTVESAGGSWLIDDVFVDPYAK